jgi:hypothetical protein
MRYAFMGKGDGLDSMGSGSIDFEVEKWVENQTYQAW